METKDTLPSLQAVRNNPLLDLQENIILIELRKLLARGFSKEQIAKAVSSLQSK